MTRRHLQIALGLLWLLAGALQLQPFMLGIGFARQVVDPVAAGQPGFVAVPIHWAANLIAAHPIAWDLPFAADIARHVARTSNRPTQAGAGVL